MKTEPSIKYGDKRRTWEHGFVSYMNQIVSHPNYNGMPAAIDESGVIRWNAPSNRPPGSKHEKLREERYEWWKNKASELDISIEGQWISQAAKKNHPFGEKPCQTCGRVMLLAYVYPTKSTIAKINKYLPENEGLAHSDFLPIQVILDILFAKLGNEVFKIFVQIFPMMAGIKKDIASFKKYLGEIIVPSEPKGLLSPGAMSNAPDRLDGFHTYNICCRHRQDTGRLATNLRTYNDDRRAFEQWVSGDWVAANALMSTFPLGTCAKCGNLGNLTADHIGPISLGFSHRPKFQFLCRGCNSAKNNRMSLDDVKKLIQDESNGEQVISWHAKKLWDLTKNSIKSDADALELSKLLRINQHYFLMLLSRVYNAGFPDLLLSFLNLDYAKYKVEFTGVDHEKLLFTGIQRSPRSKTYFASKSARMLRIAYDALSDYALKHNRNIHIIPSEDLIKKNAGISAFLKKNQSSKSKVREKMLEIFGDKKHNLLRDTKIATLFKGNYRADSDTDILTKLCQEYMDSVGESLGNILLTQSSTTHQRELLNSLNQFSEVLISSDSATH